MQPEERAEQRIQNGRHEGKRPLWGHKHRWDENIRITVQKIGWGHKLDLNGSEYGPMEDLYKDGYETLWSIQEDATVSCTDMQPLIAQKKVLQSEIAVVKRGIDNLKVT